MRNLLRITIVLTVMGAGAVSWWLYNGKIPKSVHQDQHHSDVIAVIGEEKITPDDLQFEIDLALHETGATSATALRKDMLSSLLETEVLYAYAINDKRFHHDTTACKQKATDVIADNPSFFTDAARIERIKHKICKFDAVQTYGEQYVYADIAVSDQEMEEYFLNHYQHKIKEDMIVFRQIVLASEGEAKRARITVNKGNFGSYAREYSIAPEAENGGLVGALAQSDLPQVFHVLFSMRTGQISPILKSPYGFHIALLVKKITPDTVTVNDYSLEIEHQLVSEKRLKAHQQWLERAMHTIAFTTGGVHRNQDS
ncbi:MAG: peptidylprolyl isomerase [Pseudomonadota bacterium]|nr:peptidylprolyl isomerase [Pseudomonadota bacterium]